MLFYVVKKTERTGESTNIVKCRLFIYLHKPDLVCFERTLRNSTDTLFIAFQFTLGGPTASQTHISSSLPSVPWGSCIVLTDSMPKCELSQG